MKPYQEEYIKNIRDINALTARRDPAGCSIEEYRDKLLLVREWTQQVVRRNMLLLREELFPVLDHLFEAGGSGCGVILPDSSGPAEQSQTFQGQKYHDQGVILAWHGTQ